MSLNRAMTGEVIREVIKTESGLFLPILISLKLSDVGKPVSALIIIVFMYYDHVRFVYVHLCTYNYTFSLIYVIYMYA